MHLLYLPELNLSRLIWITSRIMYSITSRKTRWASSNMVFCPVKNLYMLKIGFSHSHGWYIHLAIKIDALKDIHIISACMAYIPKFTSYLSTRNWSIRFQLKGSFKCFEMSQIRGNFFRFIANLNSKWAFIKYIDEISSINLLECIFIHFQNYIFSHHMINVSHRHFCKIEEKKFTYSMNFQSFFLQKGKENDLRTH